MNFEAGSRPAATRFLLHRQKKSGKEKTTLAERLSGRTHFALFKRSVQTAAGDWNFDLNVRDACARTGEYCAFYKELCLSKQLVCQHYSLHDERHAMLSDGKPVLICHLNLVMSSRRRPQIPANVRRAVLVEAGHRCAIPRCGHADIDIHHITPWETCEKHEYANLIALCPNCHRRAHKGEIDRKSLHLYKEALINTFQTSGGVSFSAPPIEIKRRIYEVEPSSAKCVFSFEFPDFVDPVAHIVSKNIEAWGLELLEEFRHSQDAEHRGIRIKPEYSICWLNGTYKVCRRDLKLISVRYDLEMMAFGAAHRYYETRVQNFFVAPFSPIVLEELLTAPKMIRTLAEAVNKRLISAGLNPIDVETSTTSGTELFSQFVINQFGLTFIFDPYLIASYAAGKQYVHFSFDELTEMFAPEKLNALIPPDS